MHVGVLSSVTLMIVSQMACRANSEPGTAKSAPARPDQAAVPNTAAPDTETGRVRPPGNAGEVTLDWKGARRFGAWSAELQIFEGAPHADKAELAISATGENAMRFSFSAQYAAITPADMGGLAREYVLAPGNRDNLLLLEVQKEPPMVTSGWLRVTKVEAGVVSGRFNVVLQDAEGPQTVTGQFEGPLGISCNVLTRPAPATARSGSAMNQPGASWTNVAANHPFCGQYL